MDMEAPPRESRWNRHGDRLLERHGHRIWRLGVDAGFSCPHREGGRGGGGCSFCSPDAGLAAYQHNGEERVVDLEEQIRRALGFTRSRYGAEAFFLYFQAYTCTNLPAEQLEEIYGRAVAILDGLAPGTLKGLVVSTRPDCLSREKAELLAGYAARGLEVWLELGLQSASDRTLERINRGHGLSSFVQAARLTENLGLRRASHIILGLPGESKRDMERTVRSAVEAGMEGLKFHDLRLVRGSALERNFPAGEFAPLHPSRLPCLLADLLEITPEHVEILRLCADFPRGRCLDLFPPPEKFQLHRAVEAELESRGSRQGRLCGSNAEGGGE